MPDFQNKKVLLVDGLNTFFRCFSMMKDVTHGGHAMGGLRGSLYSIGYAMKQTGATRCIVVFDGKGGSRVRRKMLPEYKENRRPKGPLTEDEQAVSDNISVQLTRLIEYVKCLPVVQMQYPGIEADDTLAYLANVLVDSQGAKEVFVMSSDKDFLQLVTDQIKVWSPTKKRVYGPDDVLKEYGVIPENMIWFRAFTGDASDNVPGVKGIGPKSVRVIPNIQEIPLTITDIENFVNSSSQKKWKNSLDTVKLNYDVMQLETSIISGTTKGKILDQLEVSDLPAQLKMLHNMIELDGTQISITWITDFIRRATI